MDECCSPDLYETSLRLREAENLLKRCAPVNLPLNQKHTESEKDKDDGSGCFSGTIPHHVRKYQPNYELPTLHNLNIDNKTNQNTDSMGKCNPIGNADLPRTGFSEHRSLPLPKPERNEDFLEESDIEQKRVKLDGTKDSVNVAEGANMTPRNFSACASNNSPQPRLLPSELFKTPYSGDCFASHKETENSSNCEMAVDALQDLPESETTRNKLTSGFKENNEKVAETILNSPINVPDVLKMRKEENSQYSVETRKIDENEDSMACVISNEYFNVGLDDFILSSVTLAEALKLLELPRLLEILDEDLEKVRTGLQSKADHETYFNNIVNKEFKKLSVKYHPDHVSRRGGDHEDINKSTEIQKSLNSVWSILKNLHKSFINDEFLGDEEFKYSMCTNVEVNILNNEERLKNINNKILIELSWLTRIKHEEIIPYLNKFMVHSDSSLGHFANRNETEFAHERQEAFLYFHMCLTGYENLVDALKSLVKNCSDDNELSYIQISTRKMLMNSGKQLEVLKNLKKKPDFRKIKDYKKTTDLAERDFVLPFVEYLYLLSVCSYLLAKRDRNWLSKKLSSGRKIASNLICSITKSVPTPDSDSSGSDDETVQNTAYDTILDCIIQSIEDLPITDFLHCCVKYSYENDKASKSLAISMLDKLKVDKLKVLLRRFNKKVAREAARLLVMKLANNLKTQFRPVKESKMYTLGQCMKDIKNLLKVFQSEFDKASKEIEEMKEERRKNEEESRKREEALQSELRDLEEQEKRIRAMLERLTQRSVVTEQTSAEENVFDNLMTDK